MIAAVSASSSSRPRGLLRWVERCWPATAQARGSEIPNSAWRNDPFVGSGTTIIAAERQGRRCFAVEISPAYCDVVVERWEAYTGKTAKKESRAEP